MCVHLVTDKIPHAVHACVCLCARRRSKAHLTKRMYPKRKKTRQLNSHDAVVAIAFHTYTILCESRVA